MPVVLTKNGNDDQRLDQLAQLAALSVPGGRNTEQRIRAVAGEAEVDISAFSENDRRLIDRLALLLDTVVPYVFRLDDDGTLAAAFGFGHLPTVAPAYLVASHSYETAVSNEVFAATVSAIENAADSTAGGVYAYQINLDIDAEALGGVGDGYRAMAGSGLGLVAGGVPVLQFNVGIYVDRAGVTVRGYINGGGSPAFEEELVGYVPGEHVIAVYIDATLGKVGYTLDGVDQGYVAGILVGAVDAIAPSLIVEQGGDITAEGWTAALEMVPVASGITEPVPAGAKDLYQTVI